MSPGLLLFTILFWLLMSILIDLWLWFYSAREPRWLAWFRRQRSR